MFTHSTVCQEQKHRWSWRTGTSCSSSALSTSTASCQASRSIWHPRNGPVALCKDSRENRVRPAESSRAVLNCQPFPRVSAEMAVLYWAVLTLDASRIDVSHQLALLCYFQGGFVVTCLEREWISPAERSSLPIRTWGSMRSLYRCTSPKSSPIRRRSEQRYCWNVLWICTTTYFY